MKHIISITITALAVSILFACGGKKPLNDDSGASREEKDQIEKSTRPLDEKNLPGSSFENNSFIALKLYLEEGQIVPDSARATVVKGKFNKGSERSDFRIEAQDVSGKSLAAVFPDNIFVERSCDEGGQVHLTRIQKGWTEIFLPANTEIAKLVFVENGKVSQQLDMKPVFEKMRREEQFNKLKKE